MSTKTKNLNLIKPEENDYVNIKDINNNMDIIDEKLATESKKIDGMLSGTASSVEIVTVQSGTIRNNSASDLTFKISSKDNETLKSIKDKSPTVINANVIAKALDGVAINGKGIPSSYNVESTNDEYVITVYSGSSSVVGQYLFAAVVTIAYERDINDIRLAELKNMCIGEDGTVYDNAGDALRGQIGQLKESISDLTDTIISINKSNVSVNVDNYENIESTIIKSNGKLESNSYTARFVVKKYINLTKASYTVKGFCQGDQCLYVLCDKNGDVIKYEDSTSQGSSGTKTVDITIDERDTILYVGGYETVIAVVKKYLYDVKLTKRLSNIYRKKVTLNGDSIAFGAGTGGTGFMDYIASKYNMTLDKKAVSGATIANLSSRYPDKHCICTSIDTMAEDANYIIFEGGYNDWLLWTKIGTLTDTMSGDLDDTKFYGALESICRQALAKWENGKIGFIITHKINDAWRTQKQEGATYTTLDGYYQAIKNVCEKYSIPYLDLSKVSRLNTELQNYKKYTYNSDGVHPTKDGYQIFYVDTIARWMENL